MNANQEECLRSDRRRLRHGVQVVPGLTNTKASHARHPATTAHWITQPTKGDEQPRETQGEEEAEEDDVRLALGYAVRGG